MEPNAIICVLQHRHEGENNNASYAIFGQKTFEYRKWVNKH